MLCSLAIVERQDMSVNDAQSLAETLFHPTADDMNALQPVTDLDGSLAGFSKIARLGRDESAWSEINGDHSLSPAHWGAFLRNWVHDLAKRT